MSASITPVNGAISHRRLRESLPPNPAPSNARPDTGNHVAYSGIPGPLPWRRSVVVVTRVVVLIMSCELCGPVLRLGMGLLFPGTHVAPVGKPLPQEIDTLSGKPLFALGVTVAVKTAGTPAGTVAVAGATASVKSFTVTLALAVANSDCPTKAEALLPKLTVPPGNVGATGVTITVTVAVAAALRVPMLHRTVLFVGAPQVPGLAVAETKVAPAAGRKSVKVTPFVNSPLLVMV